jgi:murein DD-endopeptidase MepM/ murein hydrolase activator NlpD
MNRYLLSISLLCSVPTFAQFNPEFKGGGGYTPQAAECIPAAEYTRINNMLQRNKDSLINLGLLIPAEKLAQDNQALSGILIWPVKKSANATFNEVYSVSNFVDHNANYPNQIQDWNCGTRSYDLSSGYNHSGIDIFTWPFSQYQQEHDLAEIVAAIGGTIIGKDDGYPDHSCAMANQQWNAVYIQGNDGNTYWYGHMKKNSLTSKAIGQTVAQGEKLGIVGSSGNSTGPHLHLEIYDAQNNLLDPYEGDCNQVSSMWQNQKPYKNTGINALMTHSTPPIFPNCPQVETLNAKDYFFVGDSIYFAVYMRDLGPDTAVLSIITPHNVTQSQWTATGPANELYVAAWWYWGVLIEQGGGDSNENAGAWTFQVALGGDVVTHTFYVNVEEPNTIAAKNKQSSQRLNIFPNPAKEQITISGLTAGSYQFMIVDMMGRTVWNANEKVETSYYCIAPKLASGNYMLIAYDAKGRKYASKLGIE